MVNLVVALPAEARPLVRRFRLRRDTESRGFTLFRGDAVNLVVSGVGQANAAGAVGWLQGLRGDEVCAWLNVGIAGHPQRAVGEMLLMHRITDAVTGRSWYPPVVFDPGCETERVITVPAPESAFRSVAAYDMEAAGVYPVACRFATAELVHCIKIVSDNRTNPPESLDADRISALIERRSAEVESVVATLEALVAGVRALRTPPRGYDELLAARRFSVTQRGTLRFLLETLALRGVPWESLDLVGANTAKLILASLRATLDESIGLDRVDPAG